MFLMFIIVAYVDKRGLDSIRDSCDKYNEIDFMNMSDSTTKDSALESWGDCIIQAQLLSKSFGINLVAALIFMFLVLMSLRIDNPQKRF